jgi:hypothetical protein
MSEGTSIFVPVADLGQVESQYQKELTYVYHSYIFANTKFSVRRNSHIRTSRRPLQSRDPVSEGTYICVAVVYLFEYEIQCQKELRYLYQSQTWGKSKVSFRRNLHMHATRISLRIRHSVSEGTYKSAPGAEEERGMHASTRPRT